MRFRQLRVTKGRGGCNVPGFMKDYSTDCYPPYSAEAEDVSAYGPVSVQTGLPTYACDPSPWHSRQQAEAE